MLFQSVRLKVGFFVCVSAAFTASSRVSAEVVATAVETNTAGSDFSNNGELQELVVTAQRRKEKLQDVPISVSAFSAAALESAGISGTADLPVLAAGLVFGQQAGTAQPFLRGIGTVAGGPGIENPVALYVDNVYYGAPFGQIMAFNNIDQVEVDKGPQGTLFGRNATGGLIQVTTKDPSQTLGGSVSATYGNYATAGTDVYVTDGVARNLAADLAVHFLHQGDGYGINLFNGDPVSKTQDLAMRNKWLLTTDDGTQVKAIFDYSVTHFIPNYTLAPGTIPFGPPSYAVPPQDISGLYQPFGDTHQGGASLQVQKDLEFGRFVSITAYRRTTIVSQGSAQLTTDPTFSISSVFSEKNAQLSQELQLLSLAGSRINWTVGSYLYFDNAGATPPVISSGGLVAPFDYISTYDHQKATSVAVYGQATTEIMKATNLTLGVRYTAERRDFSGSEGFGFPDETSQVVYDKEHKIYQKPTWRFALDHHFTADIMGYISYNRGFKSGAFNDLLIPTSAFSPEVLDDYELGIKNTLFDRHLILDASSFFYNYKNIQAFQYFANGLALVYNAGAARLYGLDLDAKLRVIDNLTVIAGMEAMHTKYTSFPNAAISSPIPGGGTAYTSGSADGHRLPLASDFTLSMSAEYAMHMAAYGDLTISATYLYNDGFYGEPDNRLHQPSYRVINTQLAWASVDHLYKVQAWGRNLANEQYTTSIGSQPNGDFAVFAPPRTYGVTVSRNF